MRGKFGVVLVAGALALGLASQASAQAVRGLDSTSTIRVVGARFIVHTHVGGAFYDGKHHTVNGTVDLTNQADRPRNANCTVTITFQAKSGTAIRKRRDFFKAHVRANHTKTVDYSVTLADKTGRFANQPTNQVTHCHTPYRN